MPLPQKLMCACCSLTYLSNLETGSLMTLSHHRNRLNHSVGGLQWHILSLLVGGCGLLLLLSGWLFSPAQVSAHTSQTTRATSLSSTGALIMQVNIGFDQAYRVGYWTPIHVTLNNQGANFRGTLSINTLTRAIRSRTEQLSPWNFEEPISVPRQSTKQISFNIPLY